MPVQHRAKTSSFAQSEQPRGLTHGPQLSLTSRQAISTIATVQPPSGQFVNRPITCARSHNQIPTLAAATDRSSNKNPFQMWTAIDPQLQQDSVDAKANNKRKN